MNKYESKTKHEQGNITEDKELIELPLEEKPSRWKKVLILLTAIFLILLVTSYVWISYGFDDIIISLIKSNTLEENKIKINDASTLIFKEESYQTLLAEYLETQDKEFKACLIGEIKANNYEVTKITIPEMTEQSFNQVTSKSCPEGTIAELHSHPYRRCIESEQDLKTKELIKRTNPEMLVIVMCEKDRFSFY